MTGGQEFQEAFSRFVRRSGRWRDIEPDALLSRWRDFVGSCEEGYGGDVEDYFNDLTTRDSLEQALNSAELQRFSELALVHEQVLELDSRFGAILIPDVFPGLPEASWWARGVVRFARPRLVNDLRREYHVEVALVG
jgi:hypothetical protein